MRLSKAEAEAARQRARDYEANMAIEGMALDEEGRKLADYIDKHGIGYEEGVAMVMENLRERGIIPDDPDAAAVAAE